MWNLGYYIILTVPILVSMQAFKHNSVLALASGVSFRKGTFRSATNKHKIYGAGFTIGLSNLLLIIRGRDEKLTID